MKLEQSVDPKDVQVMNWTVFHGGIVGVGIAPHVKGPGHVSAALRTFTLEDIELPGIYTDNTVAPTWLIATEYSTNPDLVKNPEKVIAYLELYLFDGFSDQLGKELLKRVYKLTGSPRMLVVIRGKSYNVYRRHGTVTVSKHFTPMLSGGVIKNNHWYGHWFEHNTDAASMDGRFDFLLNAKGNQPLTRLQTYHIQTHMRAIKSRIDGRVVYFGIPLTVKA